MEEYEDLLAFLRETLRRSRIRTVVLHYDDPLDEALYTDPDTLDTLPKTERATVRALALDAAPKTVYHMEDAFHFCYIYLPLPGKEETVLFIGPYLTRPYTERDVLEEGERLSLSPRTQKYLLELYNGMAVLSEGSPLLPMLDVFFEHLWAGAGYTTVSVTRARDAVLPSGEGAGESLEDSLIQMRTMERRYAFENEMMRAVRLGHIHMEEELFSAFAGDFFEARANTPLRNAQNYAIIMNTLLRKAAESGGVHPVHLDRTSSAYAFKIEQLPSFSACSTLMAEMFRAYCRLVRKHSVKELSPVVKRAVLIIDTDLSTDLSAGAIAAAVGVSLGYLCSVFKRETGKTVSEYVRDRRIEHARHLLETTDLQVQTVAQHCGILDAQYFSRLFKEQTGRTPLACRRARRK